MNEQKNQNGRGIFYGVIGVATLVVAIIGATFAYFTATQSNNLVITGNAASITFGLTVTRAETNDSGKGLIPMANTMVEQALSKTADTGVNNRVCIDDNGNSVCQIYKITVDNTSTASMFLDGYVVLEDNNTDGTDNPLGTATDVTNTNNPTVMRWAQAFCTFYAAGDAEVTGAEGAPVAGDIKSCTTAGTTTTGATDVAAWSQIGQDKTADATGKNLKNVWGGTGGPNALYTDADNNKSGIVTEGTILTNPYDIINRNYIRTSDHDMTQGYKRETDGSSALVFNQYLDNKNAADHSEDLYIVVWLSETGTNQTPGKTPTGTNLPNTDAEKFFTGTVTFLSAQGGEVSATFKGFTTVAVTG